MKFRHRIVLLACQLALLILVLEGLGRIVDPLGISYYPESARFFDRLIREEPIGYRLPPEMNERFWGVSVQTNSIGLRDREIPRLKLPSEYRVMLIGDSGVFSLGVEYEDSIPAQLELILNDQAPDRMRYRTLNMGVPSYNTEQELVQLERIGLDLEPDAVVLYFATNDIEPKMWVYEKRRNPLVNLAQRSYAASIVYIITRRLRSIAGGDDPELIQYSSFTEDNQRWQAIARSLTKIADHLAKRAIPFLVVSGGENRDPHMRLLRGVSAEAGFAFEQLTAGSSTSDWAAHPERYVNSAVDSHCNPAGCKVLAQELARLLKDAGML